MDVSFILVEPAVPENVGAAARSIKTMGFFDLRLVNPCNHLADEARWLAHGSNDILESGRLFPDLPNATDDLDFIIGTTAKNRSVKHDYYSPEESLEIALSKQGSIDRVGIVFGREESGLTNEELRICDIASTIPLASLYPSINLAQSVMIFSYVFSSLRTGSNGNFKNIKASQNREFAQLKTEADEILKFLEVDKNENLYFRMKERIATINSADSRLYLSFAKYLKHKFEQCGF